VVKKGKPITKASGGQGYADSDAVRHLPGKPTTRIERIHAEREKQKPSPPPKPPDKPNK
jgi:hypothetical protein